VLLIATTCIFITTGSAHAAKANVTLNGYTFSDDSANLWENQYFSSFYTAGEPCLFYGSWIYLGYGDFAHDYIAEFFDKVESYKDISCVVYREHGFLELGAAGRRYYYSSTPPYTRLLHGRTIHAIQLPGKGHGWEYPYTSEPQTQ
jgi:hypothetical protein